MSKGADQTPDERLNATARYATAPIAPEPREQITGDVKYGVGTFASRGDAQAVARSLRAQERPMRVGIYNNSGQEMHLVLAGPFANDSQL